MLSRLSTWAGRLHASTTAHVFTRLRDRPDRRRPDDGYSTEYVVITAVVVTAAIVVTGIIVAKVTARANSINL